MKTKHHFFSNRFKAIFVAVQIISLFLIAPKAHAYVTYQRLGYISCSGCHTNPTGNGLLTPYGRTIGASMAAFPYEKNPNEQLITVGAHVRILDTDAAKGQANPFLMQSDLLANALVQKKYGLDLQVGPELTRGKSGDFIKTPENSDTIVMRKSLFLAQLDDTQSIQVGRDFPVVGLNIADHSALLRESNRRGVFDYPTQLRYIYQSEKLSLIPYLSGPTFEELTANREYGLGTRGEYVLNEHNSIGGTLFYGNSPTISRTQASAFTRASLAHWNGLIAEAMVTSRNLHPTQTSFLQENLFIKPYVAYPEWIEMGWVVEYMHLGGDLSSTQKLHGPSINARIQENFSVLFDARDSITQSNSDWSWYGTFFFHFQI